MAALIRMEALKIKKSAGKNPALEAQEGANLK
jgi:hypothetical protein